MKINNIIGGLLLLSTTGCSGFLEEYSQTEIRASKISHYDELLLGSVYIPSKMPGGSFILPGGGSCDFFNMLDDDVNTVSELNIDNTGGDNYFNYTSGMLKVMFGYSAWQRDITQTEQTTHDDASTWTDLYNRIAILNTILEEADRLDLTLEEDIHTRDRVMGECHFLRGQFYFILANLYGKPYNLSTSATDLAVPLKTSSGVVHEEGKDTQFSRATVKVVYDQVVKDLEAALSYLKKQSKGVLYRASEEAAAVLLSRVYLYRQEWGKVKELLEPYISQKLYLSTLTTTDTLTSDAPFLTEENTEVLFSQGSLFSQVIFSGQAPDFCVSKDLYNLYEEGDVRRTCFTHHLVTDSVALMGKFRHTSHQSKVSDVLMIRSAEAWLNMAEACAMDGKNETLANTYLNQLRENRIRDYQARTYSGEELVRQIRLERRKELCFEGHRWFDLRRYSVSDPYPYSKKIYRSYASYDYLTLIKTGTYVLEENDPAYVFDIPKTVREFDKVSMPRNERPDRPALEDK